MKRMKRLSYLLVFALLMTTLFSGTSVFAGGDYDTPQNVKTDKTEYVTTDQGKLSFSMTDYSGVTKFEITCYHIDKMPEKKTVTIPNTTSIPNKILEYNFDISEFCSEAGTYQFFVVAIGGLGVSAEGTSAEFTVKKASAVPDPKDPDPPKPKPGITNIVAPSVTSVNVDQSYTPVGKANISGNISYGTYMEDGSTESCYNNKVELLYGTKVLRTANLSYSTSSYCQILSTVFFNVL